MNDTLEAVNEVLNANYRDIHDVPNEKLERVYMILKIVYIQEVLKEHRMPVTIFSCNEIGEP